LKQVIFDSSFLMAVVDEPTTWYEDIVDGIGKFQPVLLECVKEELQKLASGQGRRARTARVALDLAKDFESGECGGAGVDDEIISASSSRGAALATLDSELASAARGTHLRVISLKKGRVALDNV
jgi:rRNA-processing protein FCF1